MPLAIQKKSDSVVVSAQPVGASIPSPLTAEGVHGIQGKAVEATITKTYSSGAETQEKEKVGQLLEVPGPTANVGFSSSYTKNLGNYESVKVSVDLHYPVLITFDEAKDAPAINARFALVEQWVDAKMNAIITEIEGNVGKG